MNILLGVLLLFALLSGGVAVMQAVAINRLVPAGAPAWRGWLFSWWRFEAVAARAGLGGETQAAIYKRAVIACLAFVIAGLILSGWVVNARKPDAAAAVDYKINDGRVLPAVAVTINSRSVAKMPDAAVLES